MRKQPKPKWERQVDAILKKELVKDDLDQEMGVFEAVRALATDVGIPSGIGSRALGIFLRYASQELKPLGAVYTGFRLGAAWERYQQEHKEGKAAKDD